ncbi:MAG: Hemagluttinin repeat-containing protein, partial [Gammaproteobacteria bacterium]
MTLAAANGIGTATTDVDTTATSLDVSVTASGLISLDESDGVTLTAVDTFNGAITITAGGAITVTNVTATSGVGADANDINITASTGDITVTTVNNANALGDVTIQATAGSILDDEALLASTTVITGDMVTLTAANGIGTATTNVDTTATSLDASVTGAGLINLAETNGVTLTAVDTANGAITITAGDAITVTDVTATSGAGNETNDISITASLGDITITTVNNANALGDVTIQATTGSILDNADDAVADIIGEVVVLTAANGIGAAAGNGSIDTTAVSLDASVTAAGLINLAETNDVTLTAVDTFNGAITISNATGDMTVNTVATGSGGATSDSISLTATNGNITGTGPGSVTTGAATTTGGNINLTATTGAVGSLQVIVVNTDTTASTPGKVNILSNGNISLNTSTGAVIGNLDNGAGVLVEIDPTGTANLTFATGAIYANLGTDTFRAGTAGNKTRGTTLFGTNLSVGSIDIVTGGTTLGEGDVVVSAGVTLTANNSIVGNTISITGNAAGGRLTGGGSLVTATQAAIPSGGISVSMGEEIDNVSLTTGDAGAGAAGNITLSASSIGQGTPVVVKLGTGTLSNGVLNVTTTAASGAGDAAIQTNGTLRLNSLITGAGADTIAFTATTTSDDFFVLAPLTDPSLDGDFLSFVALGDALPTLNSSFSNFNGFYQDIDVGLTGTLTLKADSIDLGGTVVAGGGVTVGPVDTGADIGLGTAVADFNLSNATMVTLADAGGGSLTVASVGLGADIFIEGVDFTSVSGGAGGSLTLISAATIQDFFNNFANDFVTTASGSLTMSANGSIGGAGFFPAQVLTVAAGAITVTTSNGNDVNIYRGNTLGAAYDVTVNVATGGTGDVTVEIDKGKFVVGSISTTGNVNLYAGDTGGFVDDINDSVVDVSGASLLITAWGGFGDGGIGTAVSSIDLEGTSINLHGSNAGIFVTNDSTSTGAVTLTNADTLTGNIAFAQTGGDALTITSANATDGAVTISNVDDNLTLTSVTAGGLAHNINASTTTSGDILVGSLDASGDNVILSAAGAITDDNLLANNITASVLDATAATGIALDTAISSLSFNNSGAGGVTISNTLGASGTFTVAGTDGGGAINITENTAAIGHIAIGTVGTQAGITGGAGAINLTTTDGSITTGGAGEGMVATDGIITLTANLVAGSGTFGDIIVGVGGISSGTGNILLYAADGVALNGVVTATGVGDVTVEANSASAADFSVDDELGAISGTGKVSGDVVMLKATGGISANTAAVTLSASNAPRIGGGTPSGNISIIEDDDVTLAGVSNSTTGGTIGVTTTNGNLNTGTSAVSSTNGAITLTANDTDATGTSDATLTVGSGGVGAVNQLIQLLSDDDILISGSVTTIGNVTVTADNDAGDGGTDDTVGSINGAGLVTALTVDLDAVTGIGNTTQLELAATNISADTT